MISEPQPDWDPLDESVLQDPPVAYDQMRRRCSVAYSALLRWSVFCHKDVMTALQNPHRFSNAVGRHLSVPNGMDPPEHAGYRCMQDRYFAVERMNAFEPKCRAIALEAIGRLHLPGEVELMTELAERFVLEVQCAFLDWPPGLKEPLHHWMRRNHEAVRKTDHAALAAVAAEFDGYIRRLLDIRRDAGSDSGTDVVSQLLREEVSGRGLNDEELVSVLRNWTAGELATLAACVGILIEYLIRRADLQQLLREKPRLLPAAIDEILRIHAPLIASRRILTEEETIGGCPLAAGSRLTLMWASANRDETVFGDPDEFRLDRDPAQNLLYGAGIHACPGAPLARLQLRVLMEELLSGTHWIEAIPDRAPKRAVYPSAGFSSLPVRIR